MSFNFPFKKFPSFRDFGGVKAPINVHPPNTTFRENSSSEVVVAKVNMKYRLQKRCDKYPSCGMITISNEKDKINSINKHIPITGDIVFGINPLYLKITHYEYFGFTQQQVNEILDYESQVAFGYLKRHFNDEQRQWLIDQIVKIYTMFYPTFEIEGGIDWGVNFFIKFCIKYKVIDRRVNELIHYKEEVWDDLKQYIDENDKDRFRSEIHQIDFGLLKCFSFLHTKNRFDYLGVCEVIEKSENQNEVHFHTIKFVYNGIVDAFLLSPNIKKDAKFSLYWYRTDDTKPVKLFIYDSYADLDLLKSDMISKNEKEIKFVRGHFIGQLKDAKYMPYIRNKNNFFLMQKFPKKNLEDKLNFMTSDEIWEKIHEHERRKILINAFC